MERHARLLAIIANVDPHLELLTHDRLDGCLRLPCQFSLVNHLTPLLLEQQLGQPRRARQTPNMGREHPCFTCTHNEAIQKLLPLI